MFMHLTNYSLNKRSPVFNASDPNKLLHKRTLESYWDSLTQIHGNVRVDALQASIDDIIIKTIISAKHQLIHEYRQC